MNNKDLNTISSSKYDIYSKLLDLAASGEYISPISEFENIDFLKSSLFGYVTESLALLMRDSSFHKTMVYRENFLNTAIMPKSIYNWAKMFNVNVLDAKPSGRKATITLGLDIIDSIINNIGNTDEYKKKYGVIEDGNFMIIDKSNPIIAGKYTFMLEHSIEIYRNADNNYIVKYCLNEEDKTTDFGTYPYGGIITTLRETINDQKYLNFEVLVFQYKAIEKNKIISGSTYLDTKIHNFEIPGQICGLNLTYEKSNIVENVILKFSNIERQDDFDLNQKVAYFSLVDKDNLEISFLANTAQGLPQSGGALNLKAYITEGFNGNINFVGDAVFLIKQDDIKTLPIMVQLASNPIISGLDQTSLGEIKSMIISKLSTRNTIITENDLNTWFATQSKLLENINNSNITFRKEVDNLLRRTFSAFLLLRDGVQLNEYLTNQGSQDGEKISEVNSSYLSSVVPTNTINVTYMIPSKTAENPIDPNSDIIIDHTNSIKYDPRSYTYFITNDAGIPTTDFVFKTPFTIKLNRKYNTLSYYYLETEDKSEIEYNHLITNNNNFILVPMSVEVSHINGEAYKFKFYFSSDKDLNNLSFDSLSISFDNSVYSQLSQDIKFKELNPETDNEKTVKTYYLEINSEEITSQNIDDTSENPQIKIPFNNGNSNELSAYENTRIYLKIEMNSFSSIFQSTQEVSLFKSLNDIMSSDVIVNKNSDNKDISYTIKEVPVVAQYWIDSSINKKWFIKQLFVFINMLKSNLEKLETTTFFNIKFRNTYGISQEFNTINTMIRLKLKIYLKRDAIASAKSQLLTGFNTTESLKNEIIDFIRVAVDKSNADNQLVISKIIMQTQAAYINFIDHIDFLGLNGTFNQYIDRINKSNDKLNANGQQYPLEYFSLDNTIEIDANNIAKSRLLEDILFAEI